MAQNGDDGARAVKIATFSKIRRAHFGAEDPSSIYEGDEALYRAHMKLKQFPEPPEYRQEWQKRQFAYITLITDDKYLPGVVMLHYSVRMAERPGHRYPFIVLYTSGLSDSAIAALELTRDNDDYTVDLRLIDPLLPAAHHKISVADPRFADTWTKLRVFEQYGEYTTMVYLDADMLVTHCRERYTSKGTVFPGAPALHKVFYYAKHLPQYCIAAVHDCTCSLKPYQGHMRFVCSQNCVYHYQAYDDPPKTLIAQPGQEGPITMFNSGMFVFHPNARLWEAMEYYFENSTMLGRFLFPDQDFLVTFFKYRWASIPFTWNAVKTQKYRHGNLWKDHRVKIIHYIVDKPWMKFSDYLDEWVGFCGGDSVLHAYWWDRFEDYSGKWWKDGVITRQTEALHLVEPFLGDRDGVRPIDTAPVKDVPTKVCWDFVKWVPQDDKGKGEVKANQWDGKGKGKAKAEY